MQNETPPEYDVIVVGCGPTGATLAGLLGTCGLSVLVLEREAGIYPLPRAVHCDDEVMRVFQWIGVAEELSKQFIINRGMRFVDYHDNVLLDWPRPQQITESGWYASYRFHQPELEQVLRGALKQFDSVSVKLNAIVDGVSEVCDQINVRYRDRIGAKEATAKFLVGCDGAVSTVRRCMKSGMESLGFEQRWLVIDLLLKHPMPELGDFTIQYCDADRPATYCRNVGNRRRWEFALGNEQTSELMTQAQVAWELLKPWVTPEEATLERQVVYTFKSEVAKDWRRRGSVLAGDAAHLTPPFMGQGMCAGIRDAANLAWKLALCCDGSSDSRILDTYESERKPNVVRYIEKAVELGALINRMGTTSGDELITNVDVSATRMRSLKLDIGPGLGPDDDENRGKLFPQVRLVSGCLMDDEIGYAPFVIVDDLDEFNKIPLGITVLNCYDEPNLKSTLKGLGVKAVFVRPDRYILASIPNTNDTLTVSDMMREFPYN